jgi:hypothetical protein
MACSNIDKTTKTPLTCAINNFWSFVQEHGDWFTQTFMKSIWPSEIENGNALPGRTSQLIELFLPEAFAIEISNKHNCPHG